MPVPSTAEQTTTPSGAREATVDKGDIFAHTVHTRAEVAPTFRGGRTAMNRFISSRLRYPTDAWDANVEGKVVVRVIIEKDGTITQPQVVSSVGHGCDKETLRMIKKMPAWVPGKINGKNVRTYSLIAVQFRLED